MKRVFVCGDCHEYCVELSEEFTAPSYAAYCRDCHSVTLFLPKEFPNIVLDDNKDFVI